MSKKKPQVHKTREELLADLHANSEWIMKMKFVKEEFYPALIKATTSIDDALQNLSIINSVIMDKFLGKMKDTTMKDIDVYSNLSKDDPQYEGLKALLELFDNMTVFETKSYLEGMKSEISQFLIDEQKLRTLDTLPTKWMDEIK